MTETLASFTPEQATIVGALVLANMGSIGTLFILVFKAGGWKSMIEHRVTEAEKDIDGLGLTIGTEKGRARAEKKK